MEQHYIETIMIGIHDRMYHNLLHSTIFPEICGSKLPIIVASQPEKVKSSIHKIKLSDVLWYPKINIKEFTLPYHKTNEFKQNFPLKNTSF